MLILAVKQHACLKYNKTTSNPVISQSLKDNRCITLDSVQHAAFIYMFSRYRDQSRMRSKVRRCQESAFTPKMARPLSHPELLPTGARSTAQMQIRGSEFMSCFGWKKIEMVFSFFSESLWGNITAKGSE